jgi:hypothetical protein
VISFDAATWTAFVVLDGALGGVTLPVGEWVSAASMALDDQVAVLLFDETDPDDAVVLGPYGGIGSTPSSAPPHYRAGMAVEYVDAGNLRVSAGVLEINAKMLEEQQDSGLVALATAGNWINGVEGASMWVYVYATDDGAGGVTIKLSDECPLYPECDTASLVFTAQVLGNPAANAVSIVYDGDVGEANIRAGDELRCWTDSDYGTVRCGWRVVSVNTGTNTITVEANNCDAADNDYLTVVKSAARYRQYAGVWYRCLGRRRNDAASNLLKWHVLGPGAIHYDRYTDSCFISLAAASAGAWVCASAATLVPPDVTVADFFFSLPDANGEGDFRVKGSTGNAYFYLLSSAKITGTTPGCGCKLSPNQAIEYATWTSRLNGYVMGFREEL